LRDACPARADLAALLDEGSGSAELALQMTGQELRRYRARSFRVADDRGRALGTALVLSDVSEAAALLERLSEMAGTDEMTKAFNRRRFLEFAERELGLACRAGRPLGVILLDLDRFKLVNDRHGHAAGDAVLRAAAASLWSGMRTTDLLCRYGGEEFALLLPETDTDGAVMVAERLRAGVVGTTVQWEGTAIRFSASFGVYGGIPEPGERMEDWLKKADEAMYSAKVAGRDRVMRWRAPPAAG
jgi:diguanylate cyclase (GGDEF)-like protein